MSGAQYGYYLMLGVDSSATASDIRSAYRRAALAHHPDKVPTTATDEEKAFHERQFREIVDAVSVLLDPVLRAQHDTVCVTHVVNTVGRVSDEVDLAEFSRVSESEAESLDAVEMYELECRCGGSYCVVLRRAQEHAPNVHAECDSCSLVIRVRV